MTTETGAAASRTLDDIPGWFPITDQTLFDWFLGDPVCAGRPGDLVELGSYLGKSAVVIGRHWRDGESFTVCDLFGGPAPSESNQRELDESYSSLTRAEFERNFLAFHERLPEIVQAPSADILHHVRPGSCRFVHVDASHLYRHVRDDIAAARTLLREDGLVVLDDFRAEHTPGVAAAVWEAVFVHDLRPVCLTGQKFYATWGDPEPVQEALGEWARARPDWWMEEQEIAARPVLRLMYRPPLRTLRSDG